MNLSDRLQVARGGPAPAKAPAAARPATARSTPKSPTTAAAAKPKAARRPTTEPAAAAPVDALGKLKERASKALFERMGSRLNDVTMNEGQLHSLVRDELAKVVEQENVPLTNDERQRLFDEVGDDVLGYGPLQRLLDDPSITEIMVNGPDMIFVERNGKLVRSAARFSSEDYLRRVIERIVSRVGRRIDESSPLVDAR